MPAAVGLSFGTNTSAVAWVKPEGSVDIITNEQGLRTTASAVGFSDELLLGEAAIQRAPKNLANTIIGPQRFLHLKYSELETVEGLTKTKDGAIATREGLRIVKEDNDLWSFEVTYKEEVQRFKPTEITKIVFETMKAQAEAFVGSEVDSAVLALPNECGEQERKAIVQSANEAGLKILRAVNEPAAATLAYNLDKPEFSGYVAVYDFGAHTLDVSILKSTSGVMEVIATSSAPIGGDMLDESLMEICFGELNRRHKIEKSELNKGPRARLRAQCIAAKHTLSSSGNASIEVDNIFDGCDLTVAVNRGKFERTCLDKMAQQSIDLIDETLAKAGLFKEDIQEVVLAGGCSKIPKIQEMVTEFFVGDEEDSKTNINSVILADEAIAIGAALQASYLKNYEFAEPQVEKPCTSLAIGIETGGGVFTKIIDKNLTLPVKVTKTFSTVADQDSVALNIFEGERSFVKECTQLGEFQLKGLAKKSRGESEITVTFEVNKDGILSIIGESDCGVKNVVVFGSNLPTTGKKVEDVLNVTEEQIEADKDGKDIFWAKYDLEELAHKIISNGGDGVKLAKECLKLVTSSDDVEALQEKLTELEEFDEE